MPYSPDVLDRLGLAITEVGGVQVAVESARLHWPSGETRVVLLVQAAWSGKLDVSLEVHAASARVNRSVKISDGEVRRVRVALSLPGGVAPVVVRVRSSIPEGAERLRAPWLKEAAPAESTSAIGALVGAFRQAVGIREKRAEVRAGGEVELAVRLEAMGADAPLAAEDEAVWQMGMPEPEIVSSIRVDAPARPMSSVSRMSSDTVQPECPNCYTRVYPEMVRETQSCPSCGHELRL